LARLNQLVLQIVEGGLGTLSLVDLGQKLSVEAPELGRALRDIGLQLAPEALLPVALIGAAPARQAPESGGADADQPGEQAMAWAAAVARPR
ncbi:hypothetical protein, partial [Klebsiella aerogenes]|uniref:hypothetical protein n=1 Tax=Klebsiella aerogenes TaxID=548 RepID=UPI001953D6BE